MYSSILYSLPNKKKVSLSHGHALSNYFSQGCQGAVPSIKQCHLLGPWKCAFAVAVLVL